MKKKNTRAAVIDLLGTLYNHKHALAKIFRNDGEDAVASEYVGQAICFDICRRLLQDEAYFLKTQENMSHYSVGN